MATEVWFRNPHSYIREMVEVGVGDVVWDRGILHRYSLDPYKHARLYFGQLPWRALLVGQQGATHIAEGHPPSRPLAVYPVWEYGDHINRLEEYVRRPVGDDPEVCGDPDIPRDLRPVFGQEHRVVIIGAPGANTGPGKQLVRLVAQIQDENPECILHVHGLYGYRVAFGSGFGAVDIDPRITAQKGKVLLANGREMTYEQTVQHQQWVTLHGFRPVDLSVPRNRCMFNMKSALWAGEHYMENVKFRVRRNPNDDDFLPGPALPVINSASSPHRGRATVGDKLLCDICSLQDSCKYFRSGAVCSIPGSEPAELARFFKTRDPNMIIEGLSTLLGAQSNRLQRAMNDEQDSGELDPEVTRMINTLFDKGVKMAKLLNPSLSGKGVQVGVFVNGAGGPAAQVSAGDPASLTARAVAALEAQGIPRDKITPEMIMGMFDENSTRNTAIAAGQTINVEAQ